MLKPKMFVFLNLEHDTMLSEASGGNIWPYGTLCRSNPYKYVNHLSDRTQMAEVALSSFDSSANTHTVSEFL
jgi:hypothetical protein